MEHFSILSQVNEQLAGATDLKTFVKIVVGVFKEITGFHRVMVYQVSPI
jgi:light-regulated signal transduction histidine kinase (bacteriophytochrome)